MARSLSSIEKEILELDTTSQEEILRVLVEAIDGPTDENVDALWLEEAQRRAAELDSGKVDCEPADHVFQRIDADLKK